MDYRNVTHPQNRTVNKACQECLGAETFAQAFEMTPEAQAVIQEIKEDIESFPHDISHGEVSLKNPVIRERGQARTEFIQHLHVMGFSVGTINYLVNLADKAEAWGKVSRKTIQRALPARGLG